MLQVSVFKKCIHSTFHVLVMFLHIDKYIHHPAFFMVLSFLDAFQNVFFIACVTVRILAQMRA